MLIVVKPILSKQQGQYMNQAFTNNQALFSHIEHARNFHSAYKNCMCRNRCAAAKAEAAPGNGEGSTTAPDKGPAFGNYQAAASAAAAAAAAAQPPPPP